jgi:hypothetical protein
MSAAAVARTVAVARLSWNEELFNVVRVGIVVVLGVWMYLATAVDDAAGSRSLLPFQELVRDRPAVDQRMFRELQEGLLEAEAIRSNVGGWPQPEELAAAGVPPFAFDPTARGARYTWRLLREGTFVNYLGVPDTDSAPAWIVWVQEPEPGVPPDQNFEDEEHHRLIDGTMLHVATWSHRQGSRVPARIARVPQAEGWTQLYAVGPALAQSPTGR